MPAQLASVVKTDMVVLHQWAQSAGPHSIYHCVICGRGVLPEAQTASGMHGCMQPIAEPAVPPELINVSRAHSLICLIRACDEAIPPLEPPPPSERWRHLWLSFCFTHQDMETREFRLYISHLSCADYIYRQKSSLHHFISPITTSGRG